VKLDAGSFFFDIYKITYGRGDVKAGRSFSENNLGR
jgi:hypothetical protein